MLLSSIPGDGGHRSGRGDGRPQPEPARERCSVRRRGLALGVTVASRQAGRQARRRGAWSWGDQGHCPAAAHLTGAHPKLGAPVTRTPPHRAVLPEGTALTPSPAFPRGALRSTRARPPSGAPSLIQASPLSPVMFLARAPLAGAPPMGATQARRPSRGDILPLGTWPRPASGPPSRSAFRPQPAHS